MKKQFRFLIVVVALVSMLISACGGTANTSAGGDKPRASLVEFTGVIEAIDGNQWTINGQVITVDPAVLRDGPFAVGDTVKVEAEVQEDGSVVVTRVEPPVAGLDDNSNDDNSNDDNGNDDNSNDDNSNDSNSNGDNGNEDNGNDDNSNDDNGNDDNGNDDNSNDDNGNDDNSNDDNSNDDDSSNDDNSNDDDSDDDNSGSGGDDDDDSNENG
jgi:predicted small secreted protein